MHMKMQPKSLSKVDRSQMVEIGTKGLVMVLCKICLCLYLR